VPFASTAVALVLAAGPAGPHVGPLAGRAMLTPPAGFATSGPPSSSYIAGPGAAPISPGWVPPVCLGDVCQPLVSVPGYEPRYSKSGHRTELFLSALDRVNLEPWSSIAWYIASSGIQLDFTPGNVDGPSPNGRTGWGHFAINFRWRIDAFGRPVFPERHHAVPEHIGTR